MREASRARKRSDWALEYDIWNRYILTSNKAIVENYLGPRGPLVLPLKPCPQWKYWSLVYRHMPYESSEDSSNQPDGPLVSPRHPPWPHRAPVPPSTSFGPLNIPLDSIAQCVLCKVYFPAQPNKHRHILKFEKYYPNEHIFILAWSSARKIYFFKF